MVPEAAFLAQHAGTAAPAPTATPEQHADYLHARLAFELAERRRLGAACTALTARKRRRVAALEAGTALLTALDGTAAQVRARLPALGRALALPPSALPEPPCRGPEALARLHAVLARACAAVATGAAVAAAAPAAVRGYASRQPRVSDDMFVANAAVVLRLPAPGAAAAAQPPRTPVPETELVPAVEFRCVRSTKGLCFVTAQPLGACARTAALDDLLGDGDGDGDSDSDSDSAVLTRFAESGGRSTAAPLATAYRWAQRLGEDSKNGSDDVEALAVRVLQALQRRAEAQHALERELEALARGTVPPAPGAAPLALAPAVRLAGWTELDNGDNDDESAVPEGAPAALARCGRVFRARFVRGDVEVAALVGVAAAHPDVAPRVWLARPAHARLAPFYEPMEHSVAAAVNTLGLTPATAAARGPHILTAQLRYLLVCCPRLFSSPFFFSFFGLFFFFMCCCWTVCAGRAAVRGRA